MKFFTSSRRASEAMEARRAAVRAARLSAKAAPAMTASARRRAEARAAGVAEARTYAREVFELCEKLGKPGYAATAIRCQERDHLRREVAKRTVFAPATEAAVDSMAAALARARE